MTVLCQSLEIPARLVSGFHGGEYNPVGAFHQFRAKDAHTWVEVWLPAHGWTIFDPTPSAEIQHEDKQVGFWEHARRIADYFHFKWSTSVVSFDASSRSDLFGGFESWLRLLLEIRQKPGSLWSSLTALVWGPDLIPIWQRVCYWLMLILIGLFLLIMLRVIWILSLMVREFIQGKRVIGGRGGRRPEARFYDRLLLLLENKGYVKPPHLTPREYAAELSATNSDLGDMPRFTDWFYQAQYAGRSLSPEESEDIKSMLAKLREDPAFAAR